MSNTAGISRANVLDFLGLPTQPDPPAGIARLYFDLDTGLLAAIDSSGASVLPSGGGGTPGGNPTDVQFNDSGAFGGDDSFTFDGSNLLVPGLKVAGGSTGVATIAPQSAQGTPTLTLPTASGTFVTTAGSGLAIDAATGEITISGGGTSPGGNTGDVQFNASGSFGGDDAFFWDEADKRLGIGIATPQKLVHIRTATGRGILIGDDGFEPHIYAMDDTASTYKALVIDANTTVIADSGTSVVQQLHGGPLFVNNGLVVSTTIGTGTAAAGICNAITGYQINGVDGATTVTPLTAITSITVAAGLVTAISGTSDGKLKNFTGDIEHALAKIRLLHPRYFRWNRDGQKQTGLDGSTEHLGFFAEEVRDFIPEAVGTEQSHTDSRGHYLTLADRPIVATLVKAVQELAGMVDELQRKVLTLSPLV